MRVTNLKTFLGGADQDVGLELIRGERRIIPFNLQDSSGDPINLTGATFTATGKYYRATVTTTRTSITFSNFTEDTNISNVVIAISATSDLTEGKINLTIPETLATESQVADADATSNILVCVIYPTINLGSTSNIFKIRIAVVIRYAP